MMLMMSHATKHGDQQLVITSDVMNIAEILLIWGLPQMPPAHLAAQALSKYRNTEGDLTQADIKSIIAALSGDSFKERSPGKFIPKYKTTPMAKTSTNATQSDSESESDDDPTEDELRNDRSQAVTVKVPSHEESLQQLQRLRAGLASSGQRNQINEAEMLAKMIEGVNKLQAPHVISLFAYYLKTGPNATESDRKEWISAQARAAEAIRRGIDPSFHQYLTLQPNANTIASEEMALVQGSKFIKCLIQRLVGTDDRVIEKQERQLLTAIESYSTMTDIDKFSERVNAELTWYNKTWRYFSRPHKPATPEAFFVQALLSAVYARPSQVGLAKILSSELERDGLSMLDLLDKLKKDVKAEEMLNARRPSEVKTDTSDKKGKQKSTANQALQSTSCPECGQNHDLSQCPRAEHRKDQDAYRRGQQMPGQESPGGRGGRG